MTQLAGSGAQQRWTAQRPCPVCGHWEREPRGQGRRCAGYLCQGGKTAMCTREEHAGHLPLDASKQPPAYAHSLRGECACGVAHALASESSRRIEATYPYRDEAGTVLFEVVRFWPKAFRQRRPDPSKRDGFTWNVRGVRSVPYRLPELLADSKRMLLIPEGEADVDALRDLGLPATCNAGGAEKWSRQAVACIPKGRVPVLLLDNDAAGERHGEVTAALLREHGLAPRVVRFADQVEEGGDVRDWLALGHSREDLMAIVKVAPEYSSFVPFALPAAAGNGNGHNGNGNGNGHSNGNGNGNGHGDGRAALGFDLLAFTDTRNAKRLVRAHGERLRLDHTRGLWRIYDGSAWRLDDTDQVTVFAKDVVAHLPEEFPEGAEPSLRRRLQREVLACESTGRLRALCANAGSELPATHETWDPDPYLLNAANGTVELRTGELRPHAARDFCARICPVPYDQDCPTPRWAAFLDLIFAGDAELIAFVQRAIGVSLIGRVLEHVLFICYGGGLNGKTTFLDVWHNILGEYAHTAAPDLLMHQDRPQHLTVIAELAGSRLVSLVESSQGGRLDERTVKALTGGDPRNCNFMFHDHFTYVPGDTFWVSTNHRPQVADFSVGMRRRLRFVPFTVQIPADKVVANYAEVLRPEYPGILAWAVRGAVEYLRHGLGTAQAVEASTQMFWLDADTLAQFLTEHTKRDPDSLVSAAALFDSYSAWAEKAGERKVSQRILGLRLGERGFERVRHGHDKRWHWRGLRLRGEAELPDPDPDLAAD